MEDATSPFYHAVPDPIEQSVGWLVAIMSGPLATGICVVAIAMFGFLMMSGRLPLREGARVVIGCFVLFGAPIIALALLGIGQGQQTIDPDHSSMISVPPRQALPPSDYDPYAGASLRQD